MSTNDREPSDGPVDPHEPTEVAIPASQIADGQDPPRSRRPLLAGVVIAGLLVGGLGFVGSRALQQRDSSGTVVGTGAADSTADAAQSGDEPSEAAAGTAPPTPGTSAADAAGQPTSGAGQPGAGNDTATPSGAASAAPGAGGKAGGEQIDAYDVRVGDCLSDPGASPTIQTLTRLPCDQPHHSEAYASFDLSGNAYPGDETVSADAMKGCDDRFSTFVGRHRSESALDFSFMTPTGDTWKKGDRAVTCLIYNPTESTTGSLRASNK